MEEQNCDLLCGEKIPGYVYLAFDANTAHYCYKVGKTISEVELGKNTHKTNRRLKVHHNANPSLEIVRWWYVCDMSGAEAHIKNWFETLRKPDTKEWFDFNSKHMAEIEHEIMRFEQYASLYADAERFRQTVSRPDFRKPTPEIEGLVKKIRQADQTEARAKFERDLLCRQLMVETGDYAGYEGLVSWESSFPKKFSVALLKEREPDIYERFRRERMQRTLRLL